MSHFLQTMRSGATIDHARYDAKDITLSDMALGLSRINRFLGQTTAPFSVAQHCVVVSEIVEQKTGGDVQAMLAGLLHDAEAYAFGYVPRPFGWMLDVAAPGFMADLKADFWRALVEWARHHELTLPRELPAIVGEADDIALATEARDFMGAPRWIASLPPPLSRKLYACETSDAAERMFIVRFQEIAAAMRAA
jgi:hypothetical protein